MDHKTLFTFHGHQTPNDCMELTIEEIYQAFKARMIEELRTADTIVRVDEDCSVKRPGVRLIDTTEPT